MLFELAKARPTEIQIKEAFVGRFLRDLNILFELLKVRIRSNWLYILACQQEALSGSSP